MPRSMKQMDSKTFYAEIAPEKYGECYEKKRWQANALLQEQYRETKAAIRRQLSRVGSPKRILELGPGAGTWTVLLRAEYPSSSIDAVDVSSYMLALTRQRMGERGMRYIEADFLAFESTHLYDLFFSVRALEYLSDKEAAIRKITSLLTSGGEGLIITKMPHYRRGAWLGRSFSDLHREQIKPRDLICLLKREGAVSVKPFPVTVSFPLLRSVFLNRVVFQLFSLFPLNGVSTFLAESYGVYFKKP